MSDSVSWSWPPKIRPVCILYLHMHENVFVWWIWRLPPPTHPSSCRCKHGCLYRRLGVEVSGSAITRASHSLFFPYLPLVSYIAFFFSCIHTTPFLLNSVNSGTTMKRPPSLQRKLCALVPRAGVFPLCDFVLSILPYLCESHTSVFALAIFLCFDSYPFPISVPVYVESHVWVALRYMPNCVSCILNPIDFLCLNTIIVSLLMVMPLFYTTTASQPSFPKLYWHRALTWSLLTHLFSPRSVPQKWLRLFLRCSPRTFFIAQVGSFCMYAHAFM